MTVSRKKSGKGMPAPLGFRYGLGVGFDARRIASPFFRGAMPDPALPAGGSAFRSADLLKDRHLRRAAVGSAKAFVGRDAVADWLRREAPGALAVVFRSGEPALAPVHIDLNLKPNSSVRIFVVAEAGATGTLVIRRGGRGTTAALVEVSVGNGASVNLVRVQDLAAGDDFSRLQARIGEGGRLNLSECLFGGGYTSSWAEARLEGRQSSFRSRLLAAAAGTERFDLYRIARHLAPESSSSVRTVAVLSDSAKVIDRGLIEVPAGRRGCSGSQKTDTLTLGENAEFVAQPQLEVLEEDVRCSHAATSGQLDPETLFYLMSRGLDADQARRRLVLGFAEPLLREMRGVGMAEMVGCLMAKRVGGASE